MPSIPFKTNAAKIQEDICDWESPPFTPTSKIMATGAEAANRKAITALIKLKTPKSEIITLILGTGLLIGSNCTLLYPI